MESERPAEILQWRRPRLLLRRLFFSPQERSRSPFCCPGGVAIILSTTQRQRSLNPHKAQSFYGVEPTRQHRCALQFSLLQGRDDIQRMMIMMVLALLPVRVLLRLLRLLPTTRRNECHILADALSELLQTAHCLTFSILTSLPTVRTRDAHSPSGKSTAHLASGCICPFQPDLAPLYVLFLASRCHSRHMMGPTSFFVVVAIPHGRRPHANKLHNWVLHCGNAAAHTATNAISVSAIPK